MGSNQSSTGCCCPCLINCCNDRENEWIKEDAIKFLNIIENNILEYPKTIKSLADCIFIRETFGLSIDYSYNCVICKDGLKYPVINEFKLAGDNEPIFQIDETHKKLIQHIRTHISKKNVVMVVYIHKCLCLDKPIK